MALQDTRFIGRGESRAKHIFERLYPNWNITPQVPIQNVILREDYDFLDPVYQKHKFDFVLQPNTKDPPEIVIEINYKHGAIPAAKWNKIFYPAIIRAGKVPLAINDYECKTLFDKRGERPLKWGDFTDIISALDMVRIQP